MDQAEPFLDNWSYLRTELNWLDRVLATAIARQRKEVKEVNQVARSRADKVTSHWWKGLIQVDGIAAGDSPVEAPRRRTGSKTSYQQQLDARIQASQQQGIVLGLPSLCQALALNPFEKNLVLMALAPEVSRRYGRIYNYLQETEHVGASGLPTVDLILRLLCRNDAEWRAARFSFSSTATLMQNGVVTLSSLDTEPFLLHPVKLADSVVEYLLAEEPKLATLDHLFQLSKEIDLADLNRDVEFDIWIPGTAIAPVSDSIPSTANEPTSELVEQEDLWQALVLPDELWSALRHLCDRVRCADQLAQFWGTNLPPSQHDASGTVALLRGAAGTGKTLAARAIAQTLNTPLVCVDLASHNATESIHLIQEISTQSPTVLLLKSAQRWLGRKPTLAPERIQAFLQQRQRSRVITLFSLDGTSPIKAVWKSQMTDILDFPLPNAHSRLKLWQQAFPPALPIEADFPWQLLAQPELSGGEIYAIARDAAVYAIAEASPDAPAKLTIQHVIQAYGQRRPKLQQPGQTKQIQ